MISPCFTSFRFCWQSRTYSAVNAEEILQLERMEYYETKGYGCFNRPLVPRWLAVILASELAALKTAGDRFRPIRVKTPLTFAAQERTDRLLPFFAFGVFVRGSWRFVRRLVVAFAGGGSIMRCVGDWVVRVWPISREYGMPRSYITWQAFCPRATAGLEAAVEISPCCGCPLRDRSRFLARFTLNCQVNEGGQTFIL